MPDVSDAVEQVKNRTRQILDNAKLLCFTDEDYAVQQNELKRQTGFLKMKMFSGERKMFANCTVACLVVGHLENPSRMIQEALKNRDFDVLCVDEAGFVKLQQGLDILQMFKYCILAGDHLQLPPVIKTQEAIDLGFQKSFMEWMVEKLPNRHFMLETQSRIDKFEILVREVLCSGI